MIDCAAISGVAGEGFADSGLAASAFAASSLWQFRSWRLQPLPSPPWPVSAFCRFQPGALRFGGVGLRGILGGGRKPQPGRAPRWRPWICRQRAPWPGAVATGATAGGGCGLWAACGSACGNRRRSRSGTLPGDGAGDGVEPLFQAGDAGIQPVAIAVERIDGGGEPPRLVLGFPGDQLDLLRLPGQIGGGDLIALQSERRLVGHHGQDHRGRSRRRPRIRSATARGGRVRLPRPTGRSARHRCHPPRSPRDGLVSWPSAPGPPQGPCRITGQTLTGKAPPT